MLVTGSLTNTRHGYIPSPHSVSKHMLSEVLLRPQCPAVPSQLNVLSPVFKNTLTIQYRALLLEGKRRDNALAEGFKNVL